MKKFEFNPRIFNHDPRPNEYDYVAPGVKKYTPKTTLTDSIAGLTVEQFLNLFDDWREYNMKGHYNTFGILAQLYENHFPDNIGTRNEGLHKIYNLACEKLAMDRLNEHLNENETKE